MDTIIKKRYKIEIGEPKKINLVLIGCGGTGSFVALNMARFAWSVRETHEVNIWFVDYDYVEAKNIGRQNFCIAEVGRPKAETLATRYNYAFGLAICPVVDKFGDVKRFIDMDSTTLLVGAVDNYTARAAIANAVVDNLEMAVSLNCNLWWIDGGNDYTTGQVLLGNSPAVKPLVDKFGNCVAVPLPSVQEPDLIKPLPVVATVVDDDTLSCADLMMLNVQARTVNYQVAALIDVFMERLLMANNVDMMGVYFNQSLCTMYSVPIDDVDLFEGREKASVNERVMGEETVGRCPECGGDLVTGTDIIALDEADDGTETAIVFCGLCDWQMLYDEYVRVFDAVIYDDLEEDD